MPDYTLRDPSSGRTITVRGDSPPTEMEAAQVFLADANATPISERGLSGETGLEASGRAAKAVATNVLPGMWGAIRAPYDLAKGVVNEGPIETGKNVLRGFKGMGEDFLSGDPERMGSAAGQFAGGAAVGGMAGPAARAVGRAPSAVVRAGVRVKEIGEHMPRVSAVPGSTMPVAIARAVARPVLRTTGEILERGGRKLGGNVPFHERPVFEQMESGLPDVAGPGTSRGPGPTHQPQPKPTPTPTGPPPTLRKGGGPTLEESLGSTLDDLLQKDPELAGTPPPEPSITPAGREGVARSSGRPGVTQSRYNDIVHKPDIVYPNEDAPSPFINRADAVPEPTGNPSFAAVGEEGAFNAPRGPAGPPSATFADDAMHQALLDKLGGTAPDTSPTGPTSPTSWEQLSPGSTPHVTSWKPGQGPSAGDVQRLRSIHGHKDTATILREPKPDILAQPTTEGSPRGLPTGPRARIWDKMSTMNRAEAVEYYRQGKPGPVMAHMESFLRSKGWLQ